MEIGGFFPYSESQKTNNNYVKRMCPNAEDVLHLMSGRCAIYLCLQDSMLTDKKRVVYLPAYTCETVSGCFVKAGYTIYYYDFNEHLVPQFDESLIPEISLLMICGYYGFSTFDLNFVKKCRENGIVVLQDTTHTAFSPTGACPETDYVAVSLRKWMGVISGGLAIKKKGKFQVTPIPADQAHLSIRHRALSIRAEYERTNDEVLNKESTNAFWKAEFMLREIFDIQTGDKKSLDIINHYPLDAATEKRRENFAYLLTHLPDNPTVCPIFKTLPADVCPMFFPFLVRNRDTLMKHLTVNGIPPKVYWPVPPFIQIDDYPGAAYIYDHVMSISCDQRYSIEDMKRIVDVFRHFHSS